MRYPSFQFFFFFKETLSPMILSPKYILLILHARFSLTISLNLFHIIGDMDGLPRYTISAGINKNTKRKCLCICYLLIRISLELTDSTPKMPLLFMHEQNNFRTGPHWKKKKIWRLKSRQRFEKTFWTWSESGITKQISMKLKKWKWQKIKFSL